MSLNFPKKTFLKIFLASFFVFSMFSFADTVSADALFPGNISTCGEIEAPGTYTLTAPISATGTCITISADDVVLDGASSTITFNTSETSAVYGISIVGDRTNITIKNFDDGNFGITSGAECINFDCAAILIGGPLASSTIENNNMNGELSSIQFRGTSFNNTIVNNILGAYYGILYNVESSSSYDSIINNTINSSSDGIAFYDTTVGGVFSNNIVSGNNISSVNNGAPISLSGAASNSYNTISDNTLNGVSLGIYFSVNSSNNFITNNAITVTEGSGIYLINSTDNTIDGSNTINTGTSQACPDPLFCSGIFLSNSTNDLIEGATINSFGHGIYFSQMFTGTPFSGLSNDITPNSNGGSGYSEIYIDGFGAYTPPPSDLGTGIEGDPYQISSWSQLNLIRNNNLSAWYVLANDLTENDPDYTGIGDSWDPIGSCGPNGECGGGDNSYTFSGNFNGNGNTISGLVSTANISGLFGWSSGNISNLGVIDIDLTSGDSAGGLTGYQVDGTISNCFSSGSITTSSSAGGLVGYMLSSGGSNLITNSYSMATVYGGGLAGGLVGAFEGGAISNSYAAGAVSGGADVGGIASYAGGDLNNITNSYWDKTTSGQTNMCGGDTNNICNNENGKITPIMKSLFTFNYYSGANWDIVGGATDTNNGYPYLSMTGSSPIWMISNNTASPFVGGNGSEGEPYLIDSWTGLYFVRNNLSASYKLTRDLSSNDSDYVGIGDSWDPIGSCGLENNCWGGDDRLIFTGNFDGDGFGISTLTIDNSSKIGMGLFAISSGNISNLILAVPMFSGNSFVGSLAGLTLGGNITNVRAISGLITGASDYVGGLVGYSYSTINNSYSTAYVSGVNYVGGLLGAHNTANITNLYSTGNVSGLDYVGGLVGKLDANFNVVLSEVYSRGDVSGNSNVGGLVGDMNNTIIYAGFSTGGVNSAGSNIGGLVGSAQNSWITDSFWNEEISQQTSMCGYSNNTTGCDNDLGKSTLAMKSIYTYKFAPLNYWVNKILGGQDDNNNGYPYLSMTGSYPYWLIPGTEDGNIYSCGTIRESGTYVVQEDLESSGTCFTITADDVILDGNGHTIKFNTTPADGNSGILITGGRSGITIKNFISGENRGIWDMGFSGSDISGIRVEGSLTNSTIENNLFEIFGDSGAGGSYGVNAILFTDSSSYNTLTDNISRYVSSNFVYYNGTSDHDILVGNNMVLEDDFGIYYGGNSTNNILENNTINSKKYSSIIYQTGSELNIFDSNTIISGSSETCNDSTYNCSGIVYVLGSTNDFIASTTINSYGHGIYYYGESFTGTAFPDDTNTITPNSYGGSASLSIYYPSVANFPDPVIFTIGDNDSWIADTTDWVYGSSSEWIFSGENSTNTGTIVGDVTFSGLNSTNPGIITGNVMFTGIGSSNVDGIINGNVTVQYPIDKPLAGASGVNGNIFYVGYPGFYFDGINGDGDWGNINNWYTDDTFAVNASSVPTSTDDVTIYGDLTSGGPISAQSVIFMDGSSNAIDLTLSLEAEFFGNSSNSGFIRGNAIFYDDLSSTVNGTTTGGTIIREYTSNATTTRDFTSEGSRDDWTVIARNAIVNLVEATYSRLANLFKAYVGGFFIENPNIDGGAHVVPKITVASTTIPYQGTIATRTLKWNPSVDWDTAVTDCIYSYSSDFSNPINGVCGEDDTSLPRPAGGEHTLYMRGVDTNGNFSETSFRFFYDNTSPVWTMCGSDLLDEARSYYYLTEDVTGPCTITSNAATTTLKGNLVSTSTGYTVTGNVVGNGNNISLSNITITGTIGSAGGDINFSTTVANATTTSQGGDILISNSTTTDVVSTATTTGATAGTITVNTSVVGAITANGFAGTNGGNGGVITVATSTTGLLSSNGANGTADGGDGGNIFVTNSIGVNAALTSIFANGGNSTSCGNGGDAGIVTLTNSTYGTISTIGGSASVSGCPSESKTSGQTRTATVSGTYTPPSSGGSVSTPTSSGSSNNSSGAFRNLFNRITSPLEFIPIQPFTPFSPGFIPSTVGSTVILNPFQNLKPPGLIDFVKLPTNFLINISKFLFAPIPSTFSEALNNSPKLAMYIASVGVDKEQDLASLATSPVILKQTNDEVPGLFIIKSGETILPSYATYDKSAGGLAQLVKTSPNQSLIVSLIPQSTGTVTGIYLGQSLVFDQTTSYARTYIQTPAQGGRYILKTPSSPIPLLIEVVEPVKIEEEKKGFFSWLFNIILNWFR